MNAKRICSLLLAVLMLATSLCFTSCSRDRYLEKALCNLEEAGMISGYGDLTYPDSPERDMHYEISRGGIIVFNDVKTAKIYKKSLEQRYDEKVLYVERNIAIAKDYRKACTNAEDWRLIDRQLTSYYFNLNDLRNTKVVRRGSTLYFGIPYFMNIINGKEGRSDWDSLLMNIAYGIDDVQYEIMKIYLDIFPRKAPDNKANRELQMFETAASQFDGLLDDLYVHRHPTAKIAKIESEFNKDMNASKIERCKIDIRYHKNILSKYEDELSDAEIAGYRNAIEANQTQVNLQKKVVYAHSGCLTFEGDAFTVAMACIINFPVIRWALNVYDAIK